MVFRQKSIWLIAVLSIAATGSLYIYMRRGPVTGPMEGPAVSEEKDGGDVEKRTYTNERYGFRIEVPAGWKTFNAFELEEAGAVKEGFSPYYIFATGPGGPGDSTFIISLVPEGDYLKKHSWRSFVREIEKNHRVVHEMVSVASGFEVNKVGYMSGDDYVEEGYFTVKGGELLRMRFIVRSSKKNTKTFLQMKAIAGSLLKVGS